MIGGRFGSDEFPEEGWGEEMYDYGAAGDEDYYAPAPAPYAPAPAPPPPRETYAPPPPPQSGRGGGGGGGAALPSAAADPSALRTGGALRLPTRMLALASVAAHVVQWLRQKRLVEEHLRTNVDSLAVQVCIGLSLGAQARRRARAAIVVRRDSRSARAPPSPP